MKYKIGDKVKVKEINIVGTIENIDHGLTNIPYRVKTNHRRTWYREDQLTLCPKTIRDIEVGDVLVKDDEEHPILMRSGDVVVYGIKQGYGYKASYVYAIDELIHFGYTLKDAEGEEEIEEMTMEEVCKALGKVIKIKK